jgi:glutamate racemase
LIGIFDSGLGGLTVARSIRQFLPQYDIVYFGDTARTPYGTKSRNTVIQYATQDAELLLENGAKLIVVGCNTASSFATETLKKTFDVPIFEVITPAVQEAVSYSKKKRIGIIGTRATVGSGIYQEKIIALRPQTQVFSTPCPLLVPLVEEGWLKRSETKRIVKKYLHPLKMKQIDLLILGCTHYPLLKDVIQAKIGKRVKVIDSSEALSRSIKQYFASHPEIAAALSQSGNHRYMVSDVTEHMQRLASKILKSSISLEVKRF